LEVGGFGAEAPLVIEEVDRIEEVGGFVVEASFRIEEVDSSEVGGFGVEAPLGIEEVDSIEVVGGFGEEASLGIEEVDSKEEVGGFGEEAILGIEEVDCKEEVGGFGVEAVLGIEEVDREEEAKSCLRLLLTLHLEGKQQIVLSRSLVAKGEFGSCCMDALCTTSWSAKAEDEVRRKAACQQRQASAMSGPRARSLVPDRARTSKRQSSCLLPTCF
jgi:hypothetical protein